MSDDGRPRLADLRDADVVYQPAEDSRLLADTATGYVERGQRVLDLGTGSGYVGTHVAEATGADVVASDVSPHACHVARSNGLDVVRCHLLEAFNDGAFDAVMFNAPYLPTPADREWDDWMETALSGGESGRAVIEPFLSDLRRVIGADGEALLLISSLTGIEAVRDEARSNGLTTMIVAEEAHPNERLVVIHLVPSRGNNRDA